MWRECVLAFSSGNTLLVRTSRASGAFARVCIFAVMSRSDMLAATRSGDGTVRWLIERLKCR